ncbi:MAG: chitobiase/beta-hexosaminidase C-terminal domain-containing protein [Anaerovoracaceae bacterium]|jgi:hypothetical protein
MGNNPNKCVNCKNELDKEDLFCSICGVQINISADQAKKFKRARRWKKAFHFFAVLLLMSMAAGVGFVVGGLDLLGLKTLDQTQLDRARIYAAEGNYMKAEQSYKALINSDLENGNLYKELFNFYLINDRKDKANNLIAWSNINGLNILDGMRPSPPSCSLTSGSYSGERTVFFTSSTEGEIYYTTDGSTPNLKSSRYSGPIKLMEGKVTLKLVSESPMGILSKPAEYNYVIVMSPEIKSMEEEAAVQ